LLFHNQDGAIYEMRAAPPPSSRRDAQAIPR
jgi:hypothetical protein